MAKGLMGVAAAVAVATLVPGAVSALTTTTVNCGDSFNHSIVVGNDLSNCPGTGLTITGNNVILNLGGHTIDGDGSGAGNGIQVSGHDGVTIENGLISDFGRGVDADGDRTKLLGLTVTTSTHQGAELFGGGVLIQGSFAIGNGDDGFLVAGDGLILRKSDAISNGFAGVEALGDRPMIDSNLFRDNATESAILISGDGAKVTNNRISSGGGGINDDGAGNLISGNFIGTVSGTAIRSTQFAQITKNMIGDAVTGIVLDNGGKSTIMGNTIGFTSAGDGIQVGGGLKVSVTKNSVFEAAGVGIEIVDSHAPVDGSTVSGNTIGLAGGNGIAVSGNGALVMGNLIENAGGGGIDMLGTSTLTISGNTIGYAGGGDGIATTASSSKILGNTIRGASGAGINAGAALSTGLVIQGNSVDGAANDGIDVGGGSNTLIGNTVRGNAVDGINDPNASDKLKGNLAVGNNVGIASTAANGGGNKAYANLVTQCTGITCPSPFTTKNMGTTNLTCGTTITLKGTYVLGSDLTNCAGDGIVVEADAVVIDLNGHTVDGDTSSGSLGAGIVIDGRSGVTIKNGIVRQFVDGVDSIGGSKDTIANVISSSNLADGFLLTSANSMIDECAALQNATNGFHINVTGASLIKDVSVGDGADGIFSNGGTDGIKVDQALITGPGNSGIALGGNGEKVTNSRVLAAADYGIVLGGGNEIITGNVVNDAAGFSGIVSNDGAQVAKNVVDRAHGAGIVVGGGDGVLISGNLVGSTQTDDGIVADVGSKPTVAHNVVFSGDLYGVQVVGDSAAVAGNTVGRAIANDGIYVQGPGAMVTGNFVGRAMGNGLVLNGLGDTGGTNTVLFVQTNDGILAQGGTTKLLSNTVLYAGNVDLETASVSGDTIQGNLAVGGVQGGIRIAGDHNLIGGNNAFGNIGTGVNDTGTSDTLKGNVAVGNIIGIATSGGIDGGGNKAAGNTSTQCLNVVCTAP